MSERGTIAVGDQMKYLDLLRRAKKLIEGNVDHNLVFMKTLLELIKTGQRFNRVVMAELPSYNKHEQTLMTSMLEQIQDLHEWFADWLESELE